MPLEFALRFWRWHVGTFVRALVASISIAINLFSMQQAVGFNNIIDVGALLHKHPMNSLQAQDMSHAAAKKRYKTTNWAQYNASLKARGSLTIWLDKRMTWFAAASGKRGRSPKFSDAAI